MVEQSDGKINDLDYAILDIEPWRKAGAVERLEFLDWLRHQNEERQTHSQATYGIIFHGDPTDQGIEENLDQLFYLYWAKRKLAFVEGQRNTFRHLLESVMEFGLTETVAGDIYKALGVPKDQEI